jgi:hypothetical protein
VSCSRVSKAVKDEFLRVLNRVGSVAVAAQELGLNRITCYALARKAGVKSRPQIRDSPDKVRFLVLRSQGMTLKAGAGQVGVHRRTGLDPGFRTRCVRRVAGRARI